MDKPRISLSVPRQSVKKVKTALEQHNLLNRRIKISLDAYIDHREKRHAGGAPASSGNMIIPTLIESDIFGDADDAQEMEFQTQKVKDRVVRELDLQDMASEISILFRNPPEGLAAVTKSRNPVRRALQKYLRSLPEGLLDGIGVSATELVAHFPSTYSIYKPMLLLPAHTLESQCWKKFISALSDPQSSVAPSSETSNTTTQSPSLPTLWKSLAEAVDTTHIAINTPIPLQTSSEETNILRSPLNIAPLYNSFGPTNTDPQNPSQADLTSAFWVSTTQNSIYQTWAPLHTMFSRGNITEKTRLLNLPSIHEAVAQGEKDGRGSAALDMYAGIGYFAFCYRKVGVKSVVCFELNGWSVEGLRRGVAGNGWRERVLSGEDFDGHGNEEIQEAVKENDFLIFHESNDYAMDRLKVLGSLLPPIRHVNLGLLPSSKQGWRTAVRALDPVLGGWLHVHDNIGVGEMEGRVDGIVEEIEGMYREVVEEREREMKGKVVVRLEHVERVKTFAPGVVHCVVDVYLGVDG